MPLETMEKTALSIGAVGGGLLAPALSQFVDQPAADNAVKNGTISIPEAQPLFSRAGIMVPFIFGIPSMLLGLFGDGIRGLDSRPNLQRGLLTFGMAATVGGTIETARAVSARTSQGMNAFSPTTDQIAKAKSDFCPVRAVGYYKQPQKSAQAGGTAQCGCAGVANGGGEAAPAVNGGVIA